MIGKLEQVVPTTTKHDDMMQRAGSSAVYGSIVRRRSCVCRPSDTIDADFQKSMIIDPLVHHVIAATSVNRQLPGAGIENNRSTVARSNVVRRRHQIRSHQSHTSGRNSVFRLMNGT